jgi:hypothetical protein
MPYDSNSQNCHHHNGYRYQPKTIGTPNPRTNDHKPNKNKHTYNIIPKSMTNSALACPEIGVK